VPKLARGGPTGESSWGSDGCVGRGRTRGLHTGRRWGDRGAGMGVAMARNWAVQSGESGEGLKSDKSSSRRVHLKFFCVADLQSGSNGPPSVSPMDIFLQTPDALDASTPAIQLKNIA
jgi:hypothetical protein